MADVNDLTQNVNLWNDAKSKAVSVITDNGVERLAVDIQGGTFNMQPFVPYTQFDATGTTLSTSSWAELLNVTSTQGKLDFVACVGSSSKYRVRVTADGIEVFNVAMDDLAAIGLSNAINVPMWAETADKNFRYHPKAPVDFTDSLKVEIQATTATPLVKSLITYRELV